jgi:hypothetical protein
MTNIKNLFAGLMFSVASTLTAGAARAEIDHSWVSSAGGGIDCTRAAPCKTFQDAYNITRAGGVISVLDSGDFGAIEIHKSVTLRSEGTDGGYSVADAIGSFVNINAGATDVITLEGLRFSGVAGVFLLSGGQLNIERCSFKNSNTAGDAGISFRPAGPAKLNVTDSIIANMGSGTGGGIVVNPRSGGSAQVALERVTVNGNAFGVVADGTGSTGGINMTIADSMIANNLKDGIIATTPSGGAPIGVMVTNTKSVNNAFGARAIGPNVTVRVGDSAFTGNSMGLSYSGGGALLTFGTNKVRANGTDGGFSGPVALQ